MDDIFNEFESQVQEMQNDGTQQEAINETATEKKEDEGVRTARKRVRRTKVEVEAERLAEAQALVKEAEGKGAADVNPATDDVKSGVTDGPVDRDIPLMEAIFRIGVELKVPKNNRQVDPVSGKTWQYRSVEDILEALAPIREKYGVFISFSSHPAILGTFNYIIVEATVWNIRGESFKVTSSAREDVGRPGNWAAQISGSCESYAKKYCLQSLFMIDDSRLEPVEDPDSVKRELSRHTGQPASQSQKPQAPVQESRPAQLPLLKRGLGDWMSRLSDAAVWVGTQEAFRSKILKSYRIEEDDLDLLVAAIPEQPKA